MFEIENIEKLFQIVPFKHIMFPLSMFSTYNSFQGSSSIFLTALLTFPMNFS